MTIPLSRPPVDDQVRQAVLAAVDSRQYILGPQCRALETELAAFLEARGIGTGVHDPVPCHRQPPVETLHPPALLRTEKLVDEILSLPMSAQHSDAEIDEVVAAVREFFAR